MNGIFSDISSSLSSSAVQNGSFYKASTRSTIHNPNQPEKVHRIHSQDKSQSVFHCDFRSPNESTQGKSPSFDALDFYEEPFKTDMLVKPHQPLSFTAASIEEAATALWRQMNTCNAFLRYQENKLKPKKSSPWSIELEEAFCKALVQWPPIGREKITYKGKKRGKNELIAGSIVEQTGSEYLRDPRKEGPRKKISSHIQQLRKYFLHDTKVLRYLPMQDRNGEDSGKSRSKPSKKQKARKKESVSRNTKSNKGIRKPYAAGQIQFENPSESHCFRPRYFEMYVKDSREAGFKHLHTFTRSRQPPLSPNIQIKGVKSRKTLVPILATMVRSGLPACQIVTCEASLHVRREAIPNGAELGIIFQLNSDYVDNEHDYYCKTNVFSGDVCVNTSSKLMSRETEGYMAPFASEFWAHKMIKCTNALQDLERALKLRSDPVEELNMLQQTVESRVTESIDSLSAIQELYAVSKISGQSDKRCLIHWVFSRAWHDEDATVTWRNLDFSLLRSRGTYENIDIECGAANFTSTYSHYSDSGIMPLDAIATDIPFYQLPSTYDIAQSREIQGNNSNLKSLTSCFESRGCMPASDNTLPVTTAYDQGYNESLSWTFETVPRSALLSPFNWHSDEGVDNQEHLIGSQYSMPSQANFLAIDKQNQLCFYG